MEKICIVFVSNKIYFNKFIDTFSQLISKGKYKKDICLIIGDDLHNNKLLDCDFIKNNNIIIKYFPDIKFTTQFYNINNTIKSDGRNIKKSFSGINCIYLIYILKNGIIFFILIVE